MTFLNALHCRNKGRPPVWIMRQAGRYLPEYRELRSNYSFHEMTHRPELAAEVTLMPIQRYEFDAAIIFSDILVIPEALGFPFEFVDGVGPILGEPVTPQDVPHLKEQNSLQFVAEAIKLVKSKLSVPLLGFCGAPFTIASYMIEGGSSRDLKKTKQWLFQDPKSFHELLEILTESIIRHLKLQVEAGVDAVQLFESWAIHLGLSQLREFSFPYLQRIFREVDVPTLVFGRGTAAYVDELAELGPNGISVDWSCDISQIRKKIPQNVALQGNLDPHILYASPDTIRQECRKILASMENDPGFIFNLGHGILPDIPTESVKTLVETIKEFSCVKSSSPSLNN